MDNNNIVEIRKYSNRRLYDSSSSRYVTLNDIAEMIREGKEIRVIDSKTDEDLTRSIMLQIICESKSEQEAFPITFLRDVIQAGNHAIRDSIRDYLSLSRQIRHRIIELAKLPPINNPLISILNYPIAYVQNLNETATKIENSLLQPLSDFSENLHALFFTEEAKNVKKDQQKTSNDEASQKEAQQPEKTQQIDQNEVIQQLQNEIKKLQTQFQQLQTTLQEKEPDKK